MAFFSAFLARSSSSRAFFSSSVRGAISSVDSAKSVCSLVKMSDVQGYTPSTPSWSNLRFARMEFGLLHASELLAAFVAHHASCDFAFLESCRLDVGVGLIVLCRRGYLVEWLVLVVLEPLESSLYYSVVLAL